MSFVNKGLKSKETKPKKETLKTNVRNKRDTLPARIDWRSSGIVRPIQDQGACGSCWSFSVVDVLESHYALVNNGTLVDLSEQQLVDCVYDRDGCEGGTFFLEIFNFFFLKKAIILFTGWMSDAWDYIINNNGIDNETAYQYNSGYSGYVMEKKIQIY